MFLKHQNIQCNISAKYILLALLAFFGAFTQSYTKIFRHILSCVSESGYICQFTFWLLFDISYSDKCWTKKAFNYVKKILPLFCIVVQFCNTKKIIHNYYTMYHIVTMILNL